MEHHLPDDVSQWPSNPYELLGVKPGVAPRDLRRAYTALIRTYKPEHRPEEFRRVREAFETVQRWGTFFIPSQPDEPAVQPPTSFPGDVASPEGAVEEPPPSQAESPRLPDAEHFWSLAVEGRPAEAYRGLADLVPAAPQDTDLYARLYWLGVLFPELDPEAEAADWLTRGLDRTGCHGALLALYASELQHLPQEALSDRSNASSTVLARPES